MAEPIRFYLDCDDNGQWYLIEAYHAEDFFEWLQDESNEGKTPPAFAHRVQGSPTGITFADPRVIHD